MSNYMVTMCVNIEVEALSEEESFIKASSEIRNISPDYYYVGNIKLISVEDGE